MPFRKKRSVIGRANYEKRVQNENSTTERTQTYTRVPFQATEREIQIVHSKLRSGTTRQVIEKRKNQQNAVLFQSENLNSLAILI